MRVDDRKISQVIWRTDCESKQLRKSQSKNYIKYFQKQNTKGCKFIKGLMYWLDVVQTSQLRELCFQNRECIENFSCQIFLFESRKQKKVESLNKSRVY